MNYSSFVGSERMTIKILGIETSCDETAVGVVEAGRYLRSNVIASQVELHSHHGGVVPEVASRQHIKDMVPTLEKALADSGLALEDIDVVAATYGPGLAGSLITGLNTAKALALTLGIPLMGVNHLEGHIYASWLIGGESSPAESPGFPLACLIASGGHTDLILMEGHGIYRLVGRTRDDAAGEAFDKAARILGLGFPGGPEIQRVSQDATGKEFPPLPRAWMKDTLDFSFSGVKTALLHLAQAEGVYPAGKRNLEEGEAARLVREMAAAFQESVVDVMVVKLLEMAQRYHARGLILGGGVAANALLRQEITRRSPLSVIVPPPILCTDNGAMIAACAYFQYQRGDQFGLELDIDPALPLG
jgi:N6-L-threonylcarbamoyladenine synthase